MTLEEHRAFFSKFAKHLGLRISERVFNRDPGRIAYSVEFERLDEDISCSDPFVVDTAKRFETRFEFNSELSLEDAYQLAVNFMVNSCTIKLNRKTTVADNITNYSWDLITIPKMSSEEELMLWFAANWGI